MVIPAVEGLTMWGELSIIVDGPNVTNIARFGAKAQALIAVSKVFIIRPSIFPQGPGDVSDKAALSYPYAIEHEGKLYVGYSNGGGRHGNHNSAEMAVMPIDTLSVK